MISLVESCTTAVVVVDTVAVVDIVAVVEAEEHCKVAVEVKSNVVAGDCYCMKLGKNSKCDVYSLCCNHLANNGFVQQIILQRGQKNVFGLAASFYLLIFSISSRNVSWMRSSV